MLPTLSSSLTTQTTPLTVFWSSCSRCDDLNGVEGYTFYQNLFFFPVTKMRSWRNRKQQWITDKSDICAVFELECDDWAVV